MERRSFLKKAGVGLAAGAVAAPVIGQGTQPEVKWRMASSFPKVAGHDLRRRRCHFQALRRGDQRQVPDPGLCRRRDRSGLRRRRRRAERYGRVRHTAPYYFFGKDPTFAFACAIPFGLNTRQQNAWMYHGGGLALMREFFKDYNMISFPAGNTGAQMGGWFRKEIKTVADLKGLKFRIGGTGGAAADQARRRAAADSRRRHLSGAREGHDRRGGMGRTLRRREARLLQGRQELLLSRAGGKAARRSICFVNIKAWEALPKDYQAIFEAACYEANMDMMAKYDALNPAALKRLIGNGVKLQPFSNDILAACYKATTETYDEIADQERQVQEDLRAVEEIPRRAGLVVRRRGKPLRQLHDRGGAAVAQEVAHVHPRSRRIADSGRRPGASICPARYQSTLLLLVRRLGSRRAPFPAPWSRRPARRSDCRRRLTCRRFVLAPGALAPPPNSFSQRLRRIVLLGIRVGFRLARG